MIGLKQTFAKRLCGAGHGVGLGFDGYIDLGPDIDAQTVLSDQGSFAIAGDAHADGLHVDAGDLVEIGDRDCATIKDHLATTDAGFHQCNLIRGALIECRRKHHQNSGTNDDQNNPSKS